MITDFSFDSDDISSHVVGQPCSEELDNPCAVFNGSFPFQLTKATLPANFFSAIRCSPFLLNLEINIVSVIVYNISMYGVKEAAQKMGISDSHCRRLLEKGHVEGKKLGHDWVVLSLDYKRKRRPKEKRVPRNI